MKKVKEFLLFSFFILVSGSATYAALSAIVFTRIAYEVGGEYWEEYDSVYKVKQEYILFNFLGGVRKKYTGSSIGDAIGMYILKPLQYHFYQSALKKIPENDGERLLWQGYYNDLYSKNVTSETLHTILNQYSALASASFASSTVSEVSRIHMMKEYLFTYTAHRKLLHETPEEKIERIWEITSQTARMLRNESLDVNHFINRKSKSERIAPLMLLLNIQILLDDLIKNDLLTCTSSYRSNIPILQNETLRLVRAYAPYEQDRYVPDSPNEFQKKLYVMLLEKYAKAAPTIKAFYEEHCSDYLLRY
ncbi:MAG: hypothetical protein H6908_01795 [Hyphomicrobiales bacterium]|nr:hypothetical protein [Hyphomicrobiales bacterium]